MVGNGDADTYIVENPVVGAAEALMVLPVPLSASKVGRLLDGGEFTSSVVQVVSLITGGTVTLEIEHLALV